MNKNVSEAAKEVAGNFSEKAGKVLRSADKVVHASPYKAVGLALGVGAVIGLFLACSGASKKEA